jgi:hypothetical protein
VNPQARSREEWGVYDTEASCWLGPKDTPPYRFDKKGDARIACVVIAERFGFPVGRLEPRRHDDEPLRLRDHLTAGPRLRIVE